MYNSFEFEDSLEYECFEIKDINKNISDTSNIFQIKEQYFFIHNILFSFNFYI